jgi:KDO2-lipid IV(A) lauroyltransferase
MPKILGIETRAEPHEYVAAFGARFGIALFGCLPLDMASALGGWIGRKIGPRVRAHRIAARQMQKALPHLDEAARERALLGMWDNLGRVIAEYPHLPKLRLGDRVELVGAEHIDAVRESGKAAIFFSAHYGNWELIGLTSTQCGLPLTLVYRAANNPLTEELLQNLRARASDARHVPKGVRAARALLQALMNNESLGMLVDQKLNSGISVPFFGLPAMTAPAIAELALRQRCPVLGARVERLGGARFRVTVEPPFFLEPSGGREADVVAGLAKVHATLERWIRERPDHWFWVHKRWPKE